MFTDHLGRAVVLQGGGGGDRTGADRLVRVRAVPLLLLLAPGGPAARALAAAGRLALGHYLIQSLVLARVFTGYGFGLYDRAGTAVVLVRRAPRYGARQRAERPPRGAARGVRYGPAGLPLRTVTLARRPGRAGSTCRGAPSQCPAAAGPPPVG